MLSKAWFQLSADMSYVCLRITPGLTEPIQESDVLALLRLSNCRRYEPSARGSAKPSPCSTPSSQSRMPPRIRQSPLPGARMPGCSSRWTRTR